MAERIESTPGVEVTWDPNAPDAVLLADDSARGAVALRAHPQDADRRTVVLRFELVSYALMTPPNDEARLHHPLYDRGLGDLLWLGVVRDSSLVARLQPMWSPASDRRLQPVHFIAPTKERVIEVVAADVDVLRLEGDTREAAFAAVAPKHPRQA